MMDTPPAGTGYRPQQLKRALSLRDVVIYGVILVCPLSPAPFFGLLSQRGHGHAATAILIALFVMLPTAFSYGRMAQAYPSAGSSFTFVAREIGVILGFVTGWAMMMDYILNTLVCIIWVSQQSHIFAPALPYWGFVAIFGGLSTFLTAQGVKMTAKANIVMGITLGVVVILFLGAAAIYVGSHPHAGPDFFVRPFYDARTWQWNAILSSTSLAMLTYIGFDGISTLSEEVRNPRRNIMIATILTCVIIGILSVCEVYAAELVWPSSEHYPSVDAAFTFAAQRAWAPLFGIVGVALIAALLAVAVADQLAVARLLYAMGRSEALPKGFFGAINARSHIPLNNVLLVGVCAVVGAIGLPFISGDGSGYELGATLVNFGALISFMGVNASALVHYYVRAQKKSLVHLLLPGAGFAVCLVLLGNLGTRAIIFGFGWMAVGIAFGAWRTGGFKRSLAFFEPVPVDLPEGDPDIFKHGAAARR